MSALKPWHRAILVIALAGLAVSLLAWIARRDPAINFLSGDRRAEWIVFPAAISARAHWFSNLDATFRHEFVLMDQPQSAPLSIRAMRRAEVKINGTPVQLQPDRNWKKIVNADVVGQLHPGTNVIEARVFNHNGPPALWLTLAADQSNLRSDQTWEVSFVGSSWRPAALARAAKTPGPGNSVAGGERVFEAIRKLWPFWIVLAAIAFVLSFLWNISFAKFTPASVERVLLLTFVGLWLVLFWNNARLLPFHAGFDSEYHLKYITYIQ